MDTWELLRIQHEYSRFATIREFVQLGTDDDVDYCMNILNCVPDIDIEEAEKAILDHVGYDDETGDFSKKEVGEDWDYTTLDKVLFKYIGRELYYEY